MVPEILTQSSRILKHTADAIAAVASLVLLLSVFLQEIAKGTI